MRALLISDIHANLTALDAVLEDAANSSVFGETWVLGDSVGYGSSPNECLNRLRDIGASFIAGNHDLACAGVIDMSAESENARISTEWTHEHLDKSSVDQIMAMPKSAVKGDFTLVHGSPRNHLWEYLLNGDQAKACLPFLETRHCVIGHSHRQLLFQCGSSAVRSFVKPSSGASFSLKGSRSFINPGSVGQPRDGDNRAAYAILDLSADTVTFHRCKYDRDKEADMISEQGLPKATASMVLTGRKTTRLQSMANLFSGRSVSHRLKNLFGHREAN